MPVNCVCAKSRKLFLFFCNADKKKKVIHWQPKEDRVIPGKGHI